MEERNPTGRIRAVGLIAALSLLVVCATALAAFPEDPPNDPDYAPTEGGGPAVCSTTSADSGEHYHHAFIPNCADNADDPEDAAGMSTNEVWKRYTTGGGDTVIAYVEGGINWQDAPEELADRVYLNRGELPPPTTRKADGFFNARDFADTTDVNGNGLVDAEDIIVRFSDGVDDDGNGFVDDISGWDFYNDQNDPTTVDTEYDHANAQMRQAAAEGDNGSRGIGVCPDCMVMPIKAGAEALDRTDDLAEAWNYAARMDVDVLVSVTADLGYSSLMRQVVEDAWERGMVMVEASNDFNSTDHQGGQFWPHVLPGNGIVSNVHGLGTAPGSEALQNQLLTTFRARSGYTSWGTQNMFSAATTGGTTSEATPTVGGAMALVIAYGKQAARQGLIDAPLTNAEAIQVVRDTASDISGDTNWPSQVGFDLQFGYGRPNLLRAAEAIERGDLPPVAWFDSPRWYSLYDPTRKRKVRVSGYIDAPRQPGRFDWELQYAPGAEPDDDEFAVASRGSSRGAVDGRLGAIDLSRVPRSFWARSFELSKRKELESSERYTVTLRLQVTDSKGRLGEERRSIAVHRDRSWAKGFPRKIGPGGEAQPQLADIQDTGSLAIIFGDSNGRVHALDPKTGQELRGWPALTRRNKVRSLSPGISAGHEPVINNVAVGNLGKRGRPSVVATSTSGRVYVWNRFGRLRKGWPQTLNKGARKPAIPREQLPFTRQPIRGASAPPVLSDLVGDRKLEVIQAGWDGYVHVFDARGRERAPGFPLDVELPDGHSVPPGYKFINDQKLDTPPAIADLDGDGEPELVLRSQLSDAQGSGLQPLPIAHLHAYHSDGTPVDGWPIEVPGLVSFVGSAQEFITEGTSTPVVADVDGDGDDEVAFAPALFSPTSLFDGDGSQIGSYGPFPGALLTLGSNPDAADLVEILDGNLPDDTPVNFTTSGAFGKFGGGLTYAEPGSGAASVVGGLVLTGSGIPINNYMRAFDAQAGPARSGFPAKLQGLDFLGGPLFADISGDGAAEIINGGDTSAMHAYAANGSQAGGFPKFTTGWILWAPTVGDIDSDGKLELVAMTREGYLFVWETRGDARRGNDQWWSYRHDEHNTGRYGTDTRPPGTLRRYRARPGRLTFRAPGDDWYAGEVSHYRVWFLDRRRRALDRRGRVLLRGGNGRLTGTANRFRSQGPAGTRVAIKIPPGTVRVKVRSIDDARNVSRKTRQNLG